MKRLLALLLSVVLVMGVLTACNKKEDTKEADTKVETETKEETKTEPAAEPTAEPTEEPKQETPVAGVKTGLAVITTIASSKDASDKDGLAQADSTAAAVIVDENGVIVNCIIDTVQTKVNFSADGKITTPLDTVFVAKHELGEAYGMKKASKIGKEWYEQADALQQYVIGKTIDEVKGIAVDESGVPTSADLTSSVTVKIGTYLKAIEQAVANAKPLGAAVDNKLGLGIISTIAKSKDATADADGLAQAYTHYGVVTLDANGKITSSIIDASQGNVNFSKEGKVTTDLATEYQSKQILGDAYGMKKASKIGKEWFEQANGFASYIVGKTVDEVKGIALTDDGHAASEDLTSSVTVGIGDFLTVIEKACTTANN